MRSALLLIPTLLPQDQPPRVAGEPRWIWSSAEASADQRVLFRKAFVLDAKPASATLAVTCDNGAVVLVNGQQVASVSDWKQPVLADLTADLAVGTNVIAVDARNDEGRAGLVARLEIRDRSGQARTLVTDQTWRHGPRAKGWAGLAFADADWRPTVEVAALGDPPWGNALANARADDATVTAPDRLTVAPGFVVELVYNVPRGRYGSWVTVAADPKGRLLVSDQGGALYRVTPCAPGRPAHESRVARIELDIGAAQGLLWAHDSLYVSVNGGFAGSTSGLYRLQDTDGDDTLDKVTKLRAFAGSGEHGPHGLVLGPDGMVYVVAGNHTKLPEPFDAYLPPKVWQEDCLLPRYWDPNNHAKGILAPGGWIARTDAEGKRWELVSIGYRNAYDLAFSPEGELFSWDSDMEWDMGTPWYRPTRVTLTPPGADFGWRSGSGNASGWFVDSLPPILDVGPGSPVGMVFGAGTRFPTRYQKALFLLDWTFGTIYALHLEPSGASYTAVKEEFAFGRPWPLTDVAVGSDGALYVTVGGRGTQSGLYRIRYTGTEPLDPPAPSPPTPECRLRKQLESLLERPDAGAVAAAWPHLAHRDRFVRFAARAVVEHRPAGEWQERAFAEPDPRARIQALVALARCGEKTLSRRAFETWMTLDFPSLDRECQLDALRACSLLVTRLGMPERTTALRVAAKLDPLFPSGDWRLNRDVAGLLAVLGSPTVIAKLLDQMRADEAVPEDPSLERLIGRSGKYGGPIAKMLASKPISQALHYAYALSVVKEGWTSERRREYFTWLAAAPRQSKGGDSFAGFVRLIRESALQNVPEAERARLAPEKLLGPGAEPRPAATWIDPKGPGRVWTVAAANALTQQGLARRDFANGRGMYQAVQCAICHRFAGEGASVGPDLTLVGSRFSARDLLESILEPSKVVSDQYQSSTFLTKSGATVVGKLVGEQDGELSISTSPFDPTLVTRLKKDDVKSVRPVLESTMPTGLVNRLNEAELLDLLAFLIAGGNSQDPMFAK